jgi:hypothetical protein
MRCDLVETGSHDDEVQEQVGTDDQDRNADGFLETLEEDGTQYRQEQQGDDHLLAVQEPRYERVLGDVDRCIRRRERDRNQPAGRNEAEQDQHEKLPPPEGEQPL